MSCELFHLTRPDKSSLLYSAWKQVTDLQTKLGASADWYIHVSQAYRQEEKFAFPNLFHTLQKVSGRAKVCALCIEKKKKAPSGRGKQIARIERGLVHGTATYGCDDTKCCIIQFDLLMMSTTVLETCRGV